MQSFLNISAACQNRSVRNLNDFFTKSTISGDIYRFLYFNGQSSRQEISNTLGISLPTTTRNLNALQEEGMIENAGEFESTGGRKATIYQCVSNYRCAVGIDITRNHLTIVLIDLALNIIDSKRMRIPFRETHEYFSILQEEFEAIVSANIADRSRLLGIGISLPAIIGEDHKTVTYATVIPLSLNIYSFFSNYIHEPYLFFNDANSAGLAESWKGDYTDSVVYLSLSSSVGGAYMNGRSIHAGDNNRGGEFGHITIVPHGKRCYCGRNGCLDAYCNANALTDFTEGNLKEFFEILKFGKNKGIINIFNEYMENLAIAVNSLRMCFDCDIILGGNVGAYMSDYLDDFRKKAVKLNPFEKDGSYIQVCHYRTSASAVGAAIYYIDEFLQNF